MFWIFLVGFEGYRKGDKLILLWVFGVATRAEFFRLILGLVVSTLGSLHGPLAFVRSFSELFDLDNLVPAAIGSLLVAGGTYGHHTSWVVVVKVIEKHSRAVFGMA